MQTVQTHPQGHDMPGMQDEQYHHELSGHDSDIRRQLRGREKAWGHCAGQVRDKSLDLYAFMNLQTSSLVLQCQTGFLLVWPNG